MAIDQRQVEATIERFKERDRYRTRNERLINQKDYLDADSPARVEKFLARRGLNRQEAVEMLRAPTAAAPTRETMPEGEGVPNALERILGTDDLMGVAFLERGLQVAHSVGRIWIAVAGGRPLGYGTGFMISPRLLMTNNHVLESAAVARTSLVEFDYELGVEGSILPSVAFDLDPGAFFLTDPHLDYTVVAVQPNEPGGQSLSAFGWNPLIEQEGKAIVAQWLNIIQHPNGEVKQLCLRQNQLVDVLDDFLQYKTDTAPGSSGSPVYNDRWEVVALHHSGVWAKNAAGQILAVDGRVWDQSMGEHRIQWIANEGARVSRLVQDVRRQPMNPEQRRLFDEVFTAPPTPRETAGRETAGRGGTSTPAVNATAHVTVTADGTATWTIPLSVSVRLGDAGMVPAPSGPVAMAVPAATPATTHADDVESILALAQREWGSRADVLGVRLGYVFKNGWITGERALVVTVRQKQTPAALRDARIPMLPEMYMGLPVEVTNPSVEDLVTLARGRPASESVFAAPATLREEITYNAPGGASLSRIQARMRVIAHVSPDAGWPQLSAFLASIEERLVVGMYDFGAPHIAAAVEAAGTKASFDRLTLVMQRGEDVGAGTKADDLTDQEVVDKLSQAMGSKFENAWVKIGRVNGWVASSYHIKVAVRDQKALWVSSGNWQSSNQPDGDPLAEVPPRRLWLDKYNREWHAIVDNAELAKALEAFLLNDFRNNGGADGGERFDLPDLIVPEEFFQPTAAEKAGTFKYFAPFDEERVFTVTPLLTPDNYHDEVLKLVQSATEELLIQNQTFNAPGANQDQLRELIDAVIARQRAGVNVRVIFRLLFAPKARQVIEDLKDYGFDVSCLKVQKNCHTKGIIVDRQKVLLGSQNWSNDGVSVNRDASLLFEDVPLARYFADIFDHDWNNLAKQDIGSEKLPIESVAAGVDTPPGTVRLNWKDYMEMQ